VPLKYTKGSKQETMERSLLLFQNSLKSEKSFVTYLKNLNYFRKFINVDSFDSMIRVPQDKLQIFLEDYIMDLKTRINPNTVPTYYFPIQTFLETNDIDLKWKKIRRLFPAKIKKTGREAWSTSEIKMMLEATTSIRNKALILVLASSGIRIGGLEEFYMRNLIDMPLQCKSLLIYEESIEEYVTFITPEASEMLEKYITQRKSDGEIITGDSPIFRTSYANGAENVKGITVRGASETIKRILEKAGLRDKNSKKRGRFDKMADHAFRKRFDTTLKSNPDIPTSQVEKMVGHQVYNDENSNTVLLDGAYNVPTSEVLFNSYKHAIPELTISDYTRVRIKESEINKQFSALQEEREKHFEEKKKWYKTILNRAKTKGEIPDWLRPVMDDMIHEFES
jgi:integrase/recombinase XerD